MICWCDIDVFLKNIEWLFRDLPLFLFLDIFLDIQFQDP